MVREIALDTETTGLDPFAGHRIVEIGCVEMINHVRTGNSFHTYVNPERDMPREAENVHGLSSAFLADKPSFASIGRAFLEFIGESTLVIHNAAFDMKFLNAELEWAGLPLIPAERSLDTLLVARKKYPGQQASLDALCRRFQIDTSARIKHGALLDAELLSEVYLELCGGRQSKLVLQEEAASEQAVSDIACVGHTDISARSFPPTTEELAHHKRMLEKIKDALWQSA